MTVARDAWFVLVKECPVQEQAMRFVTVEEVVLIHDEFIAEGGPGNEPGILDVGSIETAVYRHKYGPFASDPPGISQRAAYLMRIAQDHPFFEANKRTAFEVTDFFLRHNGHEIVVTHSELVRFMLRVAGNHLIRTPNAVEEEAVKLTDISTWIRLNLENI